MVDAEDQLLCGITREKSQAVAWGGENAPQLSRETLRSRCVTECIVLGTAVKKCSGAQLCVSTEDLDRPKKDQNDLL